MALIGGLACGIAIGGLTYIVFGLFVGAGTAHLVGLLLFVVATAAFTSAFR